MSRQRKSKTENKKINPIFLILSLVFVIVTGVFFTTILKMDMLPQKYVFIFSGVELILTVVIVIGLAKGHKTYKLNVFSLILAIILATIYIFAIHYANTTMGFLDGLLKETHETEEYYIVVKKNSQYNQIADLTNKEIYMFQIEEDVKKEFESKTDKALQEQESISELGKNLLEGTSEAIALSSSQYDMLNEEIKDFKANTKIIYTATHKMEKIDIEDKNTDYTIANKAFNIYISGIDTSGRISNVARSDANIIVTVNLKKHEILLTSIPRDYYVTLHSKKAKDKLTHSGIYGINETVTTVEDLLDIDINYYVRVNFTTVIKVVDTLEGIDVTSDYSFSTENYNFKKGINHLNGKQALEFSRERHSFIDGDNQRVKNQQKVIEAIVNKVTGSTAILTKYTKILNTLNGSFQTNISQDEISEIVKEQLETMPKWTIKTNSLIGTGDYQPTYSMGKQKLYVMLPDETSVKEAKQKIIQTLSK